MGYRSDVRLIVTEEGYNTIKEIIKENDNYRNLIEEANLIEKIGKVYLFSWEEVGINFTENIIGITNILEESDKTFRVGILGESLDDFQEFNYTSSKEKNEIPYISIIRKFDDDYIKDELQILKLEDDRISSEKEAIEYE